MERRFYKKVSRNDKCSCGSGLKVKHCKCEGSVQKDDMINTETMAVRRGNEIVGTYERKKIDEDN